MVNIQLRLLGTPNQNNFNEVISVTSGNAAAVDVYKKIKDIGPEITCNKHPRHKSEVYVVAQKGGQPKLEKRNFCCADFQESLVLEASLCV